MIQLQKLPIEKWHLISVKTQSDNVDENARETCLDEGK
jgi:hypothetical protein